MIIARAPRLDPEACHRGLYTSFFTTRYVKTLSNNNYY
jgi:hypothetical protein